MGYRTDWRETLGGILFFFLWPLYIPYRILKGILVGALQIIGLDPYIRAIYVRSFGWLKMKLGFWQRIGYIPAYSKTKYDYVPKWVKKESWEKLRNRTAGDYTFNLTGRSFMYRVKFRLRGQKEWSVRYYRKLRAPLHRRVISILDPFK